MRYRLIVCLKNFWDMSRGVQMLTSRGRGCFAIWAKSAAPHKKMESYVYTSNIYEIVSQKIIKQKENFKGGRPA